MKTLLKNAKGLSFTRNLILLLLTHGWEHTVAIRLMQSTDTLVTPFF